MITLPPAIIIVVTMAGCDACAEYLPVFRQVAKRHVTVPVHYVDAAAERGSQAWQIAERYGVRATPTTLVLRRGPGSIKVEGSQDADYVEWLFKVAERA